MSNTIRSLVIAAVALAILGTTKPAQAGGGDFGLGLILGSPFGLTAKYYLGNKHAIQGAIGEEHSFGDDGLAIQLDYLWHPWVFGSAGPGDFVGYIGVGGRFLDQNHNNNHDHNWLGVRVPIGGLFDMTSSDVPIDVFLEIVPILDFQLDDDNHNHDHVDFDIDIAAGARYYF